MRLSAKVEYASLAVLELAKQWDHENPVCVRSICSSHNIPSQFLVQILLQLKAAGLVMSIRGAAGGYRLSRSPDQITLEDVSRAIDGGDELVTSLSENPMGRSKTVSVLLEAWLDVATAQTHALRAITFASLAERSRAFADSMYYI